MGNVSENVALKAKQVGVNAEKFTKVINHAVKTGEVYDGGDYALYYNFSTGQVNMSTK